MNFFMSYEEYMKQVIQPMRDELTRYGIKELRTPEEVEEALEGEAKSGTTMIVVNSVCGCAGGLARPAVAKALQHKVIPDHLYTVFAGQDREATAKAREYFTGYEPSSPSIALLKDGKIVAMVERHQIENNSLEGIVEHLTGLFDQYCN
jgi:putative YphP/YqiW family bacilliredoxin